MKPKRGVALTFYFSTKVTGLTPLFLILGLLSIYEDFGATPLYFMLVLSWFLRKLRDVSPKIGGVALKSS